MAVVKISNLPALSASDVTNDDIIPVVDGATSTTKKMALVDLFKIAPVTSVNSKTGVVSLASTDLTDESNIGRIKNINGLTGVNVSLASTHLTDSSALARLSALGNSTAFQAEYNNPTSATLNTEFEKLARILGQDQSALRASLFAVQSTANNALPSSTALSTYATKASLGNLITSASLGNSYYSKTLANNTFVTKTSIANYVKNTQLASYATKTDVNNAISSINALNLQNISCNTINALQSISTLRANIGNGSGLAVSIGGDARITGHLVAQDLTITGTTTINRSQITEIEHHRFEVNKKSDGSMSQVSGGEFAVNRGPGEANDASVRWDETNDQWEVKKGSAYSDFQAKRIIFDNSYVSVGAMPNPVAFKGMFAFDLENNRPVVSNGTEWSPLLDLTNVGTNNDFTQALTNALNKDTDGDGTPDSQDTDKDNDGIIDDDDEFPENPRASTRGFVIDTLDSESNILASTPSIYNVAYGTDTQNMYVYNGTSWFTYENEPGFSKPTSYWVYGDDGTHGEGYYYPVYTTPNGLDSYHTHDIGGVRYYMEDGNANHAKATLPSDVSYDIAPLSNPPIPQEFATGTQTTWIGVVVTILDYNAITGEYSIDMSGDGQENAKVTGDALNTNISGQKVSGTWTPLYAVGDKKLFYNRPVTITAILVNGMYEVSRDDATSILQVHESLLT